MKKRSKAVIDLKVAFDDLADGKVYDIKYKQLTTKESFSKDLKAARKIYNKNVGDLFNLGDAVSNIEDALADTDRELKLNPYKNYLDDEEKIETIPKDELQELRELFRTKTNLRKKLEDARANYRNEELRIIANSSDKNRQTIDIMKEYNSLIKEELKLKIVGGKDKKALLELINEESAYPVLIMNQLDKIYSEEIKGK